MYNYGCKLRVSQLDGETDDLLHAKAYNKYKTFQPIKVRPLKQSAGKYFEAKILKMLTKMHNNFLIYTYFSKNLKSLIGFNECAETKPQSKIQSFRNKLSDLPCLI